MRIIGIDPGIARSGWGVIEDANGKIKVLDYGCFETPKTDTIQKRLLSIHTFLSSLFDEYTPDALAVEELFFNKNTTTALIVGQARGVVLLAAAARNITATSYTPLQVKMSLTGYGRADKNQIGKMVKTVLTLNQLPKPDDTADALAIALTHAFSYKTQFATQSSNLQSKS